MPPPREPDDNSFFPVAMRPVGFPTAAAIDAHRATQRSTYRSEQTTPAGTI